MTNQRNRDLEPDSRSFSNSEGTVELSHRERRILLEDIGRIGLVIGMDLAPTVPPRAGQNVLPVSPLARVIPESATPGERLRLLLALWPQIDAALCSFARQPCTHVVVRSSSLPLAQTRGGLSTANALSRTPHGHQVWSGLTGRSAALSRTVSAPVPEARAMATKTTPANRFVSTLLRALEGEARTLAELCRFYGAEMEVKQALQLAATARYWIANTFLRDLTPLSAAEQAHLPYGDLALQCAPPYRTLLLCWRKLNRELRFDWAGNPLLTLPARQEWQLYEMWCFLCVAATLQTMGWRVVTGDAVRWEADGLRLSLTTGQASRLRFVTCPSAQDQSAPAGPYANSRPPVAQNRSQETLDLFYQPLFHSANRSAKSSAETPPSVPDSLSRNSGYASLTHGMQPDIALRWRNRLFLLDSKFRSYQQPDAVGSPADACQAQEYAPPRQSHALYEDIDKMHTYRDAIVKNRHKVVDGAWCLYPGSRDEGSSIIAYPAGTPQHPFGEAGIGAIRLRPGSSRDPLLALLTRWLIGKDEQHA
jgi:hypothetical protein